MATKKSGKARPKNIDGVVRVRKKKTADKAPVSDAKVTISEISVPSEGVDDQEIENLINDVYPEVEEEFSVDTNTVEETIKDDGAVEDLEVQDDSDDPTEIAENAIANSVAEDRALNSIKRTDKEEQAIKNSKVKGKPYRIISRILSIITIITLGAFITYVALSNAVPFKYLIIAYAIAALFSMFYIFKSFRKKTHLSVLTILNILGVIFIAGSVFGFLKYNELLRFLDQNLSGSNKTYDIYNVIVSKKSSYNSLNDVKGKEFHSITDFTNTSKLESAVKEQASGTVVYADGITSMLNDSIENPSYISLLNSGTWDATVDTTDGKTYSNSLKIIGEIKVESEEKAIVNTTSVTNSSWTMFISGIDTRSGQMVDRSLSDVNIVMTVNPKTKNILLVAVPRDYYVQLHGTTGLPDKLTHAGSLGGLELSMATVGDILDIDFNQYLRVNFNAVIDLVDAIGGITVDSDVDYSFQCYTDKSCTINPGLNDLDGKCALAFARERMAYSTGDRHRGENQEQVIAKIIEKLTSSSALIRNYSNILNALSGSFETSLTTSDITSLVNMQLDDMSKWTVESYNLNGTTGGAYTYSYPSQTLSVMFPDQSTVDLAKKKIDAVINGQKASSVK